MTRARCRISSADIDCSSASTSRLASSPQIASSLARADILFGPRALTARDEVKPGAGLYSRTCCARVARGRAHTLEGSNVHGIYIYLLANYHSNDARATTRAQRGGGQNHPQPRIRGSCAQGTSCPGPNSRRQIQQKCVEQRTCFMRLQPSVFSMSWKQHGHGLYWRLATALESLRASAPVQRCVKTRPMDLRQNRQATWPLEHVTRENDLSLSARSQRAHCGSCSRDLTTAANISTPTMRSTNSSSSGGLVQPTPGQRTGTLFVKHCAAQRAVHTAHVWCVEHEKSASRDEA